MNTKVKTFIQKAAAFGADILKRGQLTIGWQFHARHCAFEVTVFRGGECVVWARVTPEAFWRMFQGAAHWIGGGA